MIVISNEYANKHGLPGCAFNLPKIRPVRRYMGTPCALEWISRQISRQFGGMPAIAIL